MTRKPPPPPRWIYVDVDGTLLIRGQPNEQLIDWLREKHADGFKLVLWSARGRDHARATAEAFGIDNLFEAILSKPGYVVDDRGWRWIAFTRVLTGVRDEE